MFISNEDYARMQMEREDFFNRMNALLDDASAMDLATLRHFAMLCSGSESNVAYFIGVISTIFRQKYRECCIEHGVVHDHIGSAQGALFDMPVDGEVTTEDEELPEPVQNYLANLSLYNVSPTNGVAHPDSAVACINCGKTYHNLEDRMLKPDCDGCINKAKWG